MQSSITRQVIPAFAAPAILAVAIGMLSYQTTRNFTQAADAVEESNQAIGALDRLLSDVQDAETGSGDFVITGDDTRLDPYVIATGRVTQDLAEVTAELEKRPGQAERLARLRTLIDQRLQILAELVSTRRSAGFEAAQDFVKSGAGKTAMDGLRLNLAEMRAAEMDRLTGNSNDRHTTARNQLAALAALVLIEVALLAALFLYIRRYVKQRRVNAAQAVALAEARYRGIGETTALGVWATNPEGRLVYVSPGFLNYVGVDIEEYKANGWARIVARPEDRDVALDTWRTALKERGVWEIEVPVKGKDGQVRWLFSRGAPVYGDDGSFRGYTGFNMDITERKETEDALRAANAAKDEFLGLVSHELRTPLTIIAGNAQLLQRVPNMSQEDRDASLRDIHQQSERLQKLIENMLVLSRVEAADAVMSEPVLLQRIIPRLATAHFPGMTSHDVSVSIDPDLGPVAAEPTYIEQIVQNLISNAEKYSPPGAPVEVVAWRDGDLARVAVRDRGIGIAPEDIERIFEPFFRGGRTSQQSAGVGLGLSVCTRLADAMGGQMWARSREDGGSEIGVSLPLYVEDAPPEEAEAEPGDIAAPA